MSGTKHHPFVLHEIDHQIVDSDIRKYLRSELKSVCEDEEVPEDLWPGEEKIQLLCERSKQLFIYAATVCRFLRVILSTDTDDFDVALDRVLNDYRGLDDLYLGVLDYALRSYGPGLNHNRSGFKAKLKRVIGSIVSLLSPLSPSSLAALLDLKPTELQKNLKLFKSILDFSRSGNDDSPIRLLHPTFREFLINDKRCTDPEFWVDEELAQRALHSDCIKTMSKCLKEDMCGLKIPGTLIQEVEDAAIFKAFPPELRYACTYWGRHLQLTDPKLELYKDGPTHKFLRQSFLHLVESLALLEVYPQGMVLFRELKESLFISKMV